MDNSLKGLILAAGTIITCVIVGLGFYIAREARGTAASGTSQISKLNAEFSDADKILYEGAEISGSEVVNVIRKFMDEKLGILVSTNRGFKYYNYSFDEEEGIMTKSTATYMDAQNKENSFYVNPNGRFHGQVVRDDNGTIMGLCFIQK